MDIINALIVLGLGIIDPWMAVPVGLGMGLSPVATAVPATIGGVGANVVVSTLGERARLWLDRWLGGEQHDASGGRASRLWARYGVAGFGFVAPLMIGGPESVLAGLLLGARVGWLLVWVSLGTAFWTAALATFGSLALDALPSWLTAVLMWGTMVLSYVVLPAYVVHRICSRRKSRAKAEAPGVPDSRHQSPASARILGREPEELTGRRLGGAVREPASASTAPPAPPMENEP